MRKRSVTEYLSLANNPLISAAFFSALGVVVLLAYASQTWKPPMWPAVLGAAWIVPGALFATAVLYPGIVKEKTRRDALWKSILVAFVLGAGIPALWASPSARQQAVATFGTEAQLEAAVNDTSQSVRIEACRRLLERNPASEVADRVLSQRPRFAQECLGQFEDRSTAKRIGAGLANRWHRELVGASAHSTAARCDRARMMTHMPVSRRDAATKLVDCSMRSNSREVRSCCARAARRSFGQCRQLIDDLQPRRLGKANLSGWLVGASFGETTVTDRLGPVVDELGLDCPTFKRANLQLLCDQLTRPRRTERTRMYFGWLLRDNDACLEDPKRRSRLSDELVCRELVDVARRDADLDNGAICRARRRLRQTELASSAAHGQDDWGGPAELGNIEERIAASGGGGGGGVGGAGVDGGGRVPMFDGPGSGCGEGPLTGELSEEFGLKGALQAFAQSQDALDRLKENGKFEEMMRSMSGSQESAEERIEKIEERTKKIGQVRETLVERGSTSENARLFVECLKSGSEDCRLPPGVERDPCGPSLASR